MAPEPRAPDRAASLAASLPLLVVDHDGRVRYVAGAPTTSLAGHDPSTLTGQSLVDLVHPQGLVGFLDAFADVRAGARPTAEVPARVRGPDGAYRDVALQLHPLPGSTEIAVLWRDVTAGAMAEEALRAAAARGVLVEHTRALLAVLNLDGTLRFLNPAALDLYEQAQLGKGFPPVADLVHPDDLPALTARFREVAATPRRRVTCRTRLRHPDGWRTLHVELVNLAEDPAIRGVVADAIDITEQIDLAHRALHDPLTGLANRVLLKDRLAHALARLVRPTAPLSVTYVDLDDFKAVNDTLGHDAGDRVLVEVGRRLVACVRPGDTVARVGGDEFVLVCPDVPAEHAEELAERVVRAVAAPIAVAGTEVTVTASVGVVVCTHNTDAARALNAADAAMYRAKHDGGDCAVHALR